MTFLLKFKAVHFKESCQRSSGVTPLSRHLGSLLPTPNVAGLPGVYEMKSNWVLGFREDLRNSIEMNTLSYTLWVSIKVLFGIKCKLYAHMKKMSQRSLRRFQSFGDRAGILLRLQLSIIEST